MHGHASAPAQGNTSPQQGKPSPGSPAKYDWPLIKRFLHFLKPYRRGVTLGMAMIPISVLFSVLYPWLIMRIIDEQLVPGDYEGLMRWVAVLLGVMLANYISDAVYNFSLQKAAQQAIRDLRNVMFDLQCFQE